MVPTILYTREMKYFTHLEYGCTVATVVSIKGQFFNLRFYRRRRIFLKYGIPTKGKIKQFGVCTAGGGNFFHHSEAIHTAILLVLKIGGLPPAVGGGDSRTG